jgi:aminoglycoside 6'-N-acetyltransferase
MTRQEHEVRLETFDPDLHAEPLDDWLHRPHVIRWWGNLEEELSVVLERPAESHAVIVADGTPVGYLCWQKPTREELEEAGLSDLPEDLVDIDIMIGEEAFIGRGIGPKALGLLLKRLRNEPRWTMAGTATSVENHYAFRAYEKAGFRLFREFDDGEYGLSWYMTLELRD